MYPLLDVNSGRQQIPQIGAVILQIERCRCGAKLIPGSQRLTVERKTAVPGRNLHSFQSAKQLEMGEIGRLKTPETGIVQGAEGVAIQRDITIEDNERELPDNALFRAAHARNCGDKLMDGRF